MRVLVDSEEFWRHFREDLLAAEEEVFIQTFSFECDRVGEMLSEILLSLLSLRRVEVRIVVDSLSRWVFGDKFSFSPFNLGNAELRQNVKNSREMFDKLLQHGIELNFVNPLTLSTFSARNHKKLIVIDRQVAYIGGINFSEHNFLWHDMMLRIHERPIAESLAQEFLSTWNGQNLDGTSSFEGIEIHSLDGRSNRKSFEVIFELIEQAKESIFVHTPYLTFPFYKPLKQARQRDVAVTLIAPDSNNRAFLKDYILWEALRGDIEIQLYEGMTHLKALLIDDHYLVVGSTNYSFLSYAFFQEILAVITRPDVILEFKEKVLSQDLSNSRKFQGPVSQLKGQTLNLTLKSLGWLLAKGNK